MIPASVSEYLSRNHTRYSVMSHATAYTAQEEASAAHVPGREWAKAVVCFADDQPILAVVPAPCTVDFPLLQRAAGVQSIRLAREAELADLYQDCELGAMPPLGPLFGQRVFVDERLTADPEVVFSGGSHRDAIRMSYQEFERLVHPVVARFAAGRLDPPQRTTKRIDPVCGTTFEESLAAGWSEQKGEKYYFCSLSCKMEFDDNPDGYLRDKSR